MKTLNLDSADAASESSGVLASPPEEVFIHSSSPEAHGKA